MDIPDTYNPETEELSKDVQPEKVLDSMERHQKESKNNRNE
jgi:hypothetical protein